MGKVDLKGHIILVNNKQELTKVLLIAQSYYPCSKLNLHSKSDHTVVVISFYGNVYSLSRSSLEYARTQGYKEILFKDFILNYWGIYGYINRY